jgi:hypothetical protein
VVVGCAVEVALFHAGYFLYDGMSVHVVDDHGARKLQLQGGFTDTAILNAAKASASEEAESIEFP